MMELLFERSAKPIWLSSFLQTKPTALSIFAHGLFQVTVVEPSTCFSWNDGIKDYSGVIVPNNIETAKIMVPFRTHNTGNILGTYSRADNTAVIKGRYTFFDNAYAMNGKLMANGGQIPQAFALYSTSGNAVILIDALKARDATTVSAEQGGMMGISVDEFTAGYAPLQQR